MAKGLASQLAFALAVAAVLACGAADAAVTYTYDTLGRLVRVDYAPGNYVVYQYDPAGNRTAVGNATTNVPPVAVDDTVTAIFNTPLTFDPRANDYDVDYDPLTITTKTDGAHGTVTINAGTSLTYTPATGYRGTDLFTYTISDGAGHSASANVNVTVVNRPPVANPDSITSVERAPVTFDPRTNDTDPDGDPLTIVGKTDGLHGTVVINGGGTSLTYTPVATYAGPDSFTYTISDGQGNTATAPVTVTVTHNNPPTAGNNSQHIITEYTGTPVTPTGDFDLSAYISDPDPGDTVTITSLTTPVHGTVAITGAHTVHYNYGTALSGEHDGLTDSFNYTVTDSHGATNTGTVSVTIDVVDKTH